MSAVAKRFRSYSSSSTSIQKTFIPKLRTLGDLSKIDVKDAAASHRNLLGQSRLCKHNLIRGDRAHGAYSFSTQNNFAYEASQPSVSLPCSCLLQNVLDFINV